MKKQPAITAWLPWSSACQSPEGHPVGIDRPRGGQRGKEGRGIFPEAPKLDPFFRLPLQTPQLSGFSEG